MPAHDSGWRPYATAHSGVAWNLLPAAGMKYLQAWAADGAGNISLFPYGAFINYLPATDHVAVGQSRIYRYTLTAGQQLTAHVDVHSGDPDLYAWAPDYATRPPWVSNLASGDEQLSFVAPLSGEYQIEVFGYTAAEYQLTVQIAAASDQSLTINALNDTKPLPGQPTLPLESKPGAQVVVPAPPPAPRLHTYLPLIHKR